MDDLASTIKQLVISHANIKFLMILSPDEFRKPFKKQGLKIDYAMYDNCRFSIRRKNRSTDSVRLVHRHAKALR